MRRYIQKNKVGIFVFAAWALCVTQHANAQFQDSVTNRSEGIAIPGNVISTNGVFSSSPKAYTTGDEISVPTATINNMLFGRIPGLIVQDSKGEPGFDAARLFIRGKSTYNNNELVIFVDGFQVEPSYFENMSPFEISKIEVLKDAAALAPFGMRGANGILNVTTKRGQEGKPTISAQVRGGLQQPVAIRKPFRTFPYTNLYNEAYSNDNGRVWNPFYTADQVGSMPDVDWYNEVLTESTPYIDADVSLSGGDENSRYFVTFGNMNQRGLYDVPVNDTLANASVERYNVRANVDLKLASFLEAKIDLGGRIEDKRYPNRSSGNLWNELASYPGSIYPVRNEDGTWTGSPIYNFNPLASINALGRTSMHDRSLQFNFQLKEKLDMVLKGLYLSQAVSISSWTRDGASNTRNYSRFLNGEKQTTNEDTPYSRGEDNGQNQWGWQHYTATLGYHNTGEIHSFTAATNVLFNRFNTDINRNGDADRWTEYSFLNIGGYANYAYYDKYTATFAYAFSASDNYHKNHRWKFYPSVSAGWMVSNEPFIKGIDLIDLLKLRASVGLNGWDPMKVERNLWQGYYGGSGGINLGDPQPAWVGGTALLYAPNQNIGPEQSVKIDAGFDLKAFENLDINFTWFREKRSGIVSRNWVAPATAGISNPSYENIGEVTNNGLELGLSWSRQLGDFYYSLGGMAMYYKNRIDNMAEIVTLPNSARTGKSIGTVMGYKADGFYDVDDFEANGELKSGIPRPTFGEVQPGDVKYKDIFQDMVIDENDKTSIANPYFPNLIGAFNVGLGYKGFDVFLLFEGTRGSEINLLNYPNENIAFRDNGNAYAIAEQRWAYYPDQNIDTRATAAFPRLSLMHNNNNYQNSSIWIASGDYLRLRNMTLGYNFPSSFLQRAGISKFRLELTGVSILTMSKTLKDFEIDPTVPTGYPAMKSYNLGCSITF